MLPTRRAIWRIGAFGVRTRACSRGWGAAGSTLRATETSSHVPMSCGRACGSAGRAPGGGRRRVPAGPEGSADRCADAVVVAAAGERPASGAGSPRPLEVALSLERRDQTALPVALAMWELNITRTLVRLNGEVVTIVRYREMVEAGARAGHAVRDASRHLRPGVASAVRPDLASPLRPWAHGNRAPNSAAAGGSMSISVDCPPISTRLRRA